MKGHSKFGAFPESKSTNDIPTGSTSMAEYQLPEVKFDPEKHLNIKAPKAQVTFKELGISRPQLAASPIAGSLPFPLFSASAIPLLRKALLDLAYLDQTATPFSNNNLIIRNTAAHSRFFKEIWTHPDVMRAVSQAAGIALEIVMDTIEIGHGNIQVNMERYQGMGRAEMLAAVSKELTSGKHAQVRPDRVRREVERRDEKDIARDLCSEHGLIVPWHYDSYPFVCVAMLSDTTDMVGGETVIQRGDGSLIGISQPGMGSAAVLQGGLVKHLALRGSGSSDRITLVTSYRAKAVGLWDSSFLTNVRPYTDLQVLYPQWVNYRLRVIAENSAAMNRRMIFEDVPQTELVAFLKGQRDYIRYTQNQMVPEFFVRSSVSFHGVSGFYLVTDLYVSGRIFDLAPEICPCCRSPGKVHKKHLAECPHVDEWMPDSPAWADYAESVSGNLFIASRPDLEEVIHSFAKEDRHWSMADELAKQGLTEYLLDFLAFFGVFPPGK